MVMLRGPAKVDLIFLDEPRVDEPPWTAGPATLAGIDAHFWDWMLWLRGKPKPDKQELVQEHLVKLSENLLQPLGAEQPPRSIAEAVDLYRDGRDRA
jgi:hypothetical protein